ncbi:P27 family phage terminase small subunit [Campylobacter lari]|uniref:P27 family phage terminase small subunit n=1 Tax=Campylobacter lari TaxID=201 RepID=UPI0012830D84|nr:P27 family phage terminase small subunit [Campylobacter lari]EAK0948417.1 P27 family phage terminase small subunit [Campylobacter lari]EAK1241661.1 P27 family phage terminase small subunit [Campylobacter lari]MCR2070189.1 P27 family phage terminase small subunit [Campylobacter lari subsp. concheus]
MQKEFLSCDEVLQILNINSKEYLSRYLKKNGVKVLRGKAKPYPKEEILKLAKKRQDDNHHNSKQNEIALFIDESIIKEKPKNKQIVKDKEISEISLNFQTIEQELAQKVKNDLINLGIYDDLEDDIIKVYAKNLILLECSSKEVEKKGFCTTSDKGVQIITPELVAFNSLTKNVIGLAKILGIGAPSRTRVNPKEKKESSPFDVLLGKEDE